MIGSPERGGDAVDERESWARVIGFELGMWDASGEGRGRQGELEKGHYGIPLFWDQSIEVRLLNPESKRC